MRLSHRKIAHFSLSVAFALSVTACMDTQRPNTDPSTDPSGDPLHGMDGGTPQQNSDGGHAPMDASMNSSSEDASMEQPDVRRLRDAVTHGDVTFTPDNPLATGLGVVRRNDADPEHPIPLLTVHYANTMPTSAITNETDGLRYEMITSDGWGRYYYTPLVPRCDFSNFFTYKPFGTSTSSGAVQIDAQSHLTQRYEGQATPFSVVFNNPSEDIEPLNLMAGSPDLPTGASLASPECRRADRFEYEGLARAATITLRITMPRTSARCTNYCRATGEDNADCRDRCERREGPFRGEVIFSLNEQFGQVSTSYPPVTIGFSVVNRTNNTGNLQVSGTFVLN